MFNDHELCNKIHDLNGNPYPSLTAGKSTNYSRFWRFVESICSDDCLLTQWTVIWWRGIRIYRLLQHGNDGDEMINVIALKNVNVISNRNTVGMRTKLLLENDDSAKCPRRGVKYKDSFYWDTGNPCNSEIYQSIVYHIRDREIKKTNNQNDSKREHSHKVLSALQSSFIHKFRSRIHKLNSFKKLKKWRNWTNSRNSKNPKNQSKSMKWTNTRKIEKYQEIKLFKKWKISRESAAGERY